MHLKCGNFYSTFDACRVIENAKKNMLTIEQHVLDTNAVKQLS
jgi:hypothetical protein